MQDFFAQWHEAARTAAGLFWIAFWAFDLGYLILILIPSPSPIPVFVTEARMKTQHGRGRPEQRGALAARRLLLAPQFAG